MVILLISMRHVGYINSNAEQIHCVSGKKGFHYTLASTIAKC